MIDSLLVYVRSVCLRENSEVKICPLQIRRLVSVPYACHGPNAARTAARLTHTEWTAKTCLLLFRATKYRCVPRSQCGQTQLSTQSGDLDTAYACFGIDL